jgi:putative hydroxymethylpyrimidine transport system permease protein
MTFVLRAFTRWWAVALVVVLWQAAVRVFKINPFLIPGPLNIVQVVASSPGEFFFPFLFTLKTAVIGFTLGVAGGYILATVAWLWPVFRATVTPLALIIRSVPFVALIPVLTRILGYSEQTAWVICALVCFFPTFVLVTTGLRDIPANGNDLFSSIGVSTADRFRYLAAPASFPALATSLRISASSSIAAALIAEFLMGTPGLARVLSASLDQLDMTQLWAASVCSIAASIVAYLAASRFESHIIARWR